ncbi:ferric reduction oxidase 8 mitochondrial [Phtheirospermum japonicum]|uniref:Ferric reduction oxidase 8 mitochondrial n=1 Tax=Phtheirospermum japonicum TaxID=374723 RepID=A0A830C3B9_9LAMI|nr:ferric reduction oxidase 8 mitochondrial [Phtheirospermum japonicum]
MDSGTLTISGEAESSRTRTCRVFKRAEFELEKIELVRTRAELELRVLQSSSSLTVFDSTRLDYTPTREGLDFAVYTFPVIALAIIGFIYVELNRRKTRNRQGSRNVIFTYLSSPLIVNQYIGILSGAQIIASSLFIVLLVWTFYVRVANDFKKMTPNKSFKLSLWQYKMFRMATRCGLLSEACLALLLLPVLRGISVFRLIGIQFEASIRYHIWLGNAMMFFATLHGAGTFFIWGLKHRIQDEMWKWQKKGRIYLAGEMALITGDRHFYMVFPGVFLFALDKLLRILQSMPKMCILSARVLPCRAIELTLLKDPRLKYAPTSLIFLKIPSISKFQWHPFSIISSSSMDKNTFSIIVKSGGQWTSSLYDQILAYDHDSEADQSKCIPIAIEGPYGPASLEFLRYNNLLMVAGGIGITPFLSIVQELSSNPSITKNGYPNRVQIIYTTRKAQDVCLLEPILAQLQNIEQFHTKLKLYVTRENQFGATLRDVINRIPEIQTRNFSTACVSHATYGPERLLIMAMVTLASSIVFLLSLVFFNRFVVPPDKKQKSSSSQIDLILLCSFSIAIIVSALLAVVMRRKRLKKEVRFFSDKQSKPTKSSSFEDNGDLDEHEIHFGGRPDFQDILSNFSSECGGSDIGVLVCGPVSMKESLAIACRQGLVSRGNAKGNNNRPYFNFHSLNFTL